MAIAEMTFTQQRELERAAKKQAEEKKLKKIKSAIADGSFAETASGSRIINPDHIAAASQYIVDRVVNASNDAKLSVALKAALKPLTVVSDDGQYPLANNVAIKTLKAVLNGIAAEAGDKHVADDGTVVFDSMLSQKVMEKVAAAVEKELRLISMLESDDHKLLAKAVKAVENNVAYSQEAKDYAYTAACKGLNPFEQLNAWFADPSGYKMPEATADAPVWIEADVSEWLKAGNFFEKAVEQCAGADDFKFWKIVMVTDEVDGKKDTKKYFAFTDSLVVDEVILQEILAARSKKPMRTLPINWMNGVYGGYASNQEVKADAFIRGIHGRDSEAQISNDVYRAVNRLQQVAFTINSFMLDTVDQLLPMLNKQSAKIGKFVAPVKGVHYTKTVVSRAAIAAAHEFNDGNPFWCPWNVDYRGRMYPIATVLNIQSTEFEKSLLTLAESQPVNEQTKEWLSIHIANCFGLDKKPLNERVQWVEQNEAFIKKVSMKPSVFLKAVARKKLSADKPFCFVAACKEYADIFIDNVKTDTNLLVAVDATCSGIQILSGLIKDESAALLVNVKQATDETTRQETKGDAYGSVAILAAQMMRGEVKVAKKIKDQCEPVSEYAQYLNRSICKKVVMTLAYNSSPKSHREALFTAVKDAGIKLPSEVKSDVISAYGVVIREAMKKLLPGVMSFKKWINDRAKAQAAAFEAEREKSPEPMKFALSWATPSGFQVIQHQNVWKKIELETAFGKMVLNVKETDTALPKKHGTCTMPNLVHSLDASLLHSAFCDFDKPFSLIHDSVMTTASDVTEAIDLYKAAYVKHFSKLSDSDFLNTVYELFAAGVEDSSLPKPGKLRVEDVLVSKYFLS